MNTRRALLLAATLLLASSSAVAQTYYWPDSTTVATFIYGGYCELQEGQTHTFETRNLSANADTVMHLIQGAYSQLHEVAYNDDCPGSGSLRSCITYQVPPGGGGVHYVIVYAYSPTSGGLGGKTWEAWLDDNYQGTYKLGGYVVHSDQSSQESFETVLVPNGAPFTYLMRLDYDGNHFKPAAHRWGGGVGLASKLWGNGNSKWVIAITGESSPEGPVRALRNDALLRDADGDGLGDYLEEELDTCASLDSVLSGSWSCRHSQSNPNPADTDGDGLGDYLEAVGLSDDDAALALTLPQWGANPRHKDVFVEVDRETSAAHFTRQDIEWAAERYRVLQGMQNPDWVDGIALHVDIDDRAYPPGEQCSTTLAVPLCGYWGGSEVNRIDDGCTLSPSRAANRANVFRWGEYYHGDLGSSVVPSRDFCFGDQQTVGVPGASAFTHELGHSLGVHHWGADATGVAQGKPNYVSLMNYSYEWWVNGSRSVWFSDGSRGITPLYANDLTELNAYATSVDLTALSGAPFFLNVDSGRHVDWNRDGQFDMVRVKAHINPHPEHHDIIEGDSPVQQSWGLIPGLVMSLGPGAAYLPANNYTYVVAHSGSALKFTRNYYQSNNTTWATWNTMPSTFYHSLSQPAVAAFTTKSGQKLFVFIASSTGAIRYATINSANQVSSWSTAFTNPAGVTFQEVSAAPYTTSDGISLLVLVARDVATGDVWWGYLHTDSYFYGWNRVVVDGANLKSRDHTPAITAGPDFRLYMVVKSDDLTNRTGCLALFALTASAWLAEWGEINGNHGDFVWNEPGGCGEVMGRPAMAYRPHVDSAGQEITTGHGALWVYYAVPDPNPLNPSPLAHYRFSWGPFGTYEHDFGTPATRGPLSMGRWHYPGHKTGTLAGAVAVASHPGNLAAFISHAGGDAPGVTRIPFADGMVSGPRPLNDNDDAATMRERMCEGLGTCGGQGRAALSAPVLVRCEARP